MRRDRGEPVGCFVLLSALLARSTFGALGREFPQAGPDVPLEVVEAPSRVDASTSGPRRRNRSPGDARGAREQSDVSWAPGVGAEYDQPPEPSAPPAGSSSRGVQPGPPSAPPARADGPGSETADSRVDRSAAPPAGSEPFRGGSGTFRESLHASVGPPLSAEQSGVEGRSSARPSVVAVGGDGASPPTAATPGGDRGSEPVRDNAKQKNERSA